MKIELTKKEFKKLIKLTFMGEFMSNSIKTKDDREKESEELLKKLLKIGKEKGFSEFISRNEDGEIYPSKELEFDDDITQKIKEYDFNVFMEELVSQLSDRDLKQEFDINTIKDMDPMEFFEKEEKYYDKRWEEIYNNGVDNLKLKENKDQDNKDN